MQSPGIDSRREEFAGDVIVKKGKLVVLSGPSGVGKTTIVSEVRRRTGVLFSVSATTRKPRPGEADGKDYYFVDHEEFRRMIDAGKFLEWAEVFGLGQYYGTPADPVKQAVASGKTIVLDIDVQGGLQVAKAMPDATFVLILPPDDATLEKRLRGRGTEDEATVQKRLAKAKAEIDTAQRSGVYNCRIVNDDLERAVQQVVEIVQ